MVKGREKYQARQQALGFLGTQLNRRAGSRCELCSSGGVPLRPHEVAPQADDPEFERCILICDRCRTGAEGGDVSPQEWRFLEEVAWSDIPPLQVTAVRLLRTFPASEAWAATLLETLYLSPEVQGWLEA